MADTELRIDKYLWAVRIFKTRTLASEACTKGQVTVDGYSVKPSRHVKTGETIMVRKPPMVHSYKVLSLLHTRLSAEKAKQYIEEVTPEEEFMKVEMIRMQKNPVRDRGAGRPTKRDRRRIDDLWESTSETE